MTALPTVCEEYLAWLGVERGRADSTLRAYRLDLGKWTSFLALHGGTVEGATTSQLETFLADVGTGRTESSVARLASTLHGLYGFLVEEGVVDVDPTALLAPRHAASRLPVVLTEAQVTALLESPATDEPVDVRDRAVLELLYGTGIRVSELVGLDLGDVDFEEELVRVTGKGDKQRLVPLGRRAERALRRWLAADARGVLLSHATVPADTRAVFCNLRGRRLSRQGVDLLVRRHARRVALPEGTSAHTLRHTCATHMLTHGADVRVIQELLGHASVATTQRYTKVTPSHLIEAYTAAHPRAGDDATAT